MRRYLEPAFWFAVCAMNYICMLLGVVMLASAEVFDPLRLAYTALNAVWVIVFGWMWAASRRA